jgi:Type I phosphodiesterase / nucleotide pyrophosphatase
VMGPAELFYADVFASRDTGCRSALGKPGLRDQHAGCVGSYLFEHDLCDFLLLSLPDNDTHSHRFGPDSQVASIAAADRQIERMAHAAGGIDAFLDSHALVVAADHSHALIERRIEFEAAFRDFHVLGPSAAAFEEAEIALCPSARSAQIYVLVPEGRDALLPRIVTEALALEGVEHVLYRAGDEGVLRAGAGGGELRFAAGGELRDARGATWSVDGDLGVLDARVEDGLLVTPGHPDALARCWAALQCPTSGDVLLSAAPGFEFPDWGGVDHVGGGSHGSLHHSDSLGALLFCGVDAPARQVWGIQDVAPLCASAFGLDWPT